MALTLEEMARKPKKELTLATQPKTHVLTLEEMASKPKKTQTPASMADFRQIEDAQSVQKYGNLNPEFLSKHPTFAKIITPLYKASKQVDETAVGRFLGRVGQRTAEYATAGEPEKAPDVGKANVIADILGFGLSFGVPGGVTSQAAKLGGLTTSIGSKGIGKIAGKVASKAAQNTYKKAFSKTATKGVTEAAKKVAEEAAAKAGEKAFDRVYTIGEAMTRGVGIGTGIGLGESAAKQEGLKETAKTVGKEAATWVGFEAGAGALGIAGKALWEKLPDSTKEELLNLPKNLAHLRNRKLKGKPSPQQVWADINKAYDNAVRIEIKRETPKATTDAMEKRLRDTLLSPSFKNAARKEYNAAQKELDKMLADIKPRVEKLWAQKRGEVPLSRKELTEYVWNIFGGTKSGISKAEIRAMSRQELEDLAKEVPAIAGSFEDIARSVAREKGYDYDQVFARASMSPGEHLTDLQNRLRLASVSGVIDIPEPAKAGEIARSLPRTKIPVAEAKPKVQVTGEARPPVEAIVRGTPEPPKQRAKVGTAEELGVYELPKGQEPIAMPGEVVEPPRAEMPSGGNNRSLQLKVEYERNEDYIKNLLADKKRWQEVYQTDARPYIVTLKNAKTAFEKGRTPVLGAGDIEKAVKELQAYEAEIARNKALIKEEAKKATRGKKQEKPDTAGRNRLTADPEELAADYKSKGLSKHRAWDQFIIDRALRPEIDAKKFYQIYEKVPPKAFHLVEKTGQVSPTHILEETFATQPKRVQIVKETPEYVSWVDEKGIEGSTPRNFIKNLKPIKTSITEGQTVYGPAGQKLTVVDASDKSLLKVRNEQGTEFKIGQKVVRPTVSKDFSEKKYKLLGWTGGQGTDGGIYGLEEALQKWGPRKISPVLEDTKGELYDILESYATPYSRETTTGKVVVRPGWAKRVGIISEEEFKMARGKAVKSETLAFTGLRQMDKPSSIGQGVTPVKKKEIVNYLSKKLDIPIRVGRYSNRRALGIFKVKPEVVRTKLAEDLEVISHEIGHYLDKRLGLSKMGFDDEITKLAEGLIGNARKEGVAQFINLYLANPEKAKEIAPKYFEAFEKRLTEYPEIAEVLGNAQQQIKTWLEQPAKAKVLGSLSVGQGTPKRPMTTDRIYTAIVDELRPLEKAVREITKGTKIDVDKDPFFKAWLSRGWRGKAETALRYGQVDENLKKIGPSFNEIIKPVEKDLNDFRAYITSKRALELANREIETGIDPADAKQAIREIKKELGEERVKDFENALKKLVEFQDYILNRLAKTGILSKETLGIIREMNKNYVPFYRLFNDSVGTLKFQGKTYANLSTPIKRLKGSGRTIVDPLESIIKNTYVLTNLAERNDVGRSFVELAEKFEGSGRWIEKVATPKYATKFQLNEIEKALQDAGVDTSSIDLEKMAAIFRPSIFPAGKENIVTIYRNGKPEFYQLDPELYRAMLFLDKESSNILTKLLSYPTSVLRAGATLTPEFIARNPVRDQFVAFVNSKYGFIPVVDLIKGLSHIIKKDDLYWKWYQSGGAHSAFVSVDRDYLQKNLRQLLQRDLKSRAKNVVKNPLELLRALSEATEEATRVQEFAKGLKKGASPAEAALASRDITLDFGRAGTIGKEANRLIAFLNSGIQGIDKLVRQWKSDPIKSTYRAILSITLPSVILYTINRDNKYYQEIPQWEKDIYWLIPYNNGKNFIRIPKPFELGILFGTIPERFLAYVDKQDPKAFKDIGDTIKQYIFLDMLPDKERGFGPGGIFPPGLIPTALVPMLEVWANRSTFTGYPIVPQREQKLPPEMQYGPYTSEVAKIIGKATHTSPRQIEQAVYGYTAGLGRNIASLIDLGLDVTGIVERTPKPTGTLADVPLVRGFVSRNPTAGQSASIDDFYELYNKTEQLQNKLKKTLELGQELSKLKPEEIRQLAALKTMRQIAKQLSNLRRVSLRVQNAKNLTPEQKRKALDQLDKLQINLVRRAFGKEPL